jgi:type II restriction/modification system DNA methylase subunit YeeA
LRKASLLDPACGSGNFLYLALQTVKDIENKAILDAETLGCRRVAPRVGPEILHGIEINPFAAELSRTTIWIGDIQWRVKNAIHAHPRPIPRKLDNIECRDALLTSEGTEAEWPEADFIIGNPPFLGTKKLIGGHCEAEAMALRRAYEGRVAGFSDLVCWWFEKARAQIVDGKLKRAGLVATNSIRGGVNRSVLDAICRDLEIYSAWADEGWTVEGAAVRVSIVCFAPKDSQGSIELDGKRTETIHPDLTAHSQGAGVNLTLAQKTHRSDLWEQ